MAEESPLTPLLDALCRAAFAPQSIVQYGPGGAPEIVPTPSPLVVELASHLRRAVEADESLRALILAEMTKPENVSTLAGELAHGVGKMRVNQSSYGSRVDVPDWVREALTDSLKDWLATEEADGLIPQMLERSKITITVERKDANEARR